MGLTLERMPRWARRRFGPVIEDCRAEPDYSLWLLFDDGLEGRVYLGNLLEVGEFSAWRDLDRFLDVSVDPDTGTVQWQDGIRLDPGALYKDLASRVRAALH
ncbi:MAG TPA: DUF2442 domain-containing protein [Thermomicrobiales bacterium]|nr:DUF2442 domain-containing protein [Thermomicrobiales bacterium]